MTCIEKLRELHPDWDDEKIKYYSGRYCVSSKQVGYIMPRSYNCAAHGWEDSDDTDCEECWNREVDENRNRYLPIISLTGEDMRRLDSLAERTGYYRDKVVQAALRLLEGELDTYGESAVVEDWSMEVKMDG